MDDAEEARHIKVVRRAVWRRSLNCELCGDTEHQTRLSGAIKWSHEMHEDPPRSKTRGLPLEQRFSLKVCCRACPPCHWKQTENIKGVRFMDEEQRFAGDFDVIDRDGRILRRVRR